MRPLVLPLTLFALAVCPAAEAADLAGIDRTVSREPAYKGKPLYCLVVVGPKAKARVWLVLDGEVLYVDKKGTGDLTQAERVKPRPDLLMGLLRLGGKEPRVLRFACAVTKDITIELTTTDGRPVQVEVRDARRKLTLAAGRDDGGRLQLSDRPATAPVIDAGGRLTMHVPSGQLLKRHVSSWDLTARVGSAGLGAGTFAWVDHDGVPARLHPVAEIEFPARGGGERIRRRFTLDRRC